MVQDIKKVEIDFKDISITCLQSISNLIDVDLSEEEEKTIASQIQATLEGTFKELTANPGLEFINETLEKLKITKI